MGMPDIGEFPHHHRPSDVLSFSERFPRVKILVTHNYARSTTSKSGFEIPELPSEIVQLNDGDSIEIDISGKFTVNNYGEKISIIYICDCSQSAVSDFIGDFFDVGGWHGKSIPGWCLYF